jgi:hypothetical protein
MRSQVRSLIACLLFAGTPAYAGAQELSLDAKSYPFAGGRLALNSNLEIAV